MQITDPNQIEIGMKVYYAYCIGYTFIFEHTITSLPYEKSDLSLFVNTDKGDLISLKDCNVIPNTYNKHRLYTTKIEAEEYLAEMRNSNKVPPFNEWY